jgi:peptide/nickel transport system substrate-binding protein
MASTFRGLAMALLLLVTACSGTPFGCGPGAPPPPATAITASLRNEPTLYNRLVDRSAGGETLGLLLHARLLRVNRATDVLEPWLAERWTGDPDGRTYTLTLRRDVRFSDGTPFTSADVLFTFRALYDTDVNSPIAIALRPGDQPLAVTAPDANTVVITFPARFAPGLRLLDHLPILPRHKLEAALDGKQFRDAWKVGTPLSDMAGLGPFVLAEHASGQRLVLRRNPHYWRRDEAGRQLPYADTLTLTLISDQNAEAIRVAAGDIDLMVNGDIRPEDHATFTRAAADGKLRLIDVGIGDPSPYFLWFNLSPSSPADKPWIRRREFRQAVSFAADRQAIVNTVFLGEAAPVYGPISPGNRTWYSDAIPQYPHDPAKARALLAGIGLADRDGDGVLEDAAGRAARLSVLTQRGHLRERIASMLQQQLRAVGIQVDVVGLDTSAIVQRFGKGDYDAVYYGFQVSATDPALNPEFWFSSGQFHVWNPQQKTPATEWERRIDELMHQQMEDPDLAARQRHMTEIQRILGEELPAIFFVAPKVTIAVSTRLGNATPALQIPQLLWNADSLTVAAARPPGS